MTALHPGQFDLDTAPISVAQVTLLVQDLARMTRFYTEVLGLSVFPPAKGAAHADSVQLGVTQPCLRLHAPGGLRRAAQSQPGLYHTAFLLPSRRALGAWLQHATRHGLRPIGADHQVSEALYLFDPEGNGIEVYADRPTDCWYDAAGRLRLTTDPLNPQGLSTPTAWNGAPTGTRIGHVHLKTPDLQAAEGFWAPLGFEIMAQSAGVLFWGTGGYHHQLATNIWASAGQAPRNIRMTGLSEITFQARLPPQIRPPKPLTAPSGVQINFIQTES